MNNILYIVILIVVSFDFTQLGTFHFLCLRVQSITNLLLLTVHPISQSLLKSRLPPFKLFITCTMSLHFLLLHCDICDYTLSKEWTLLKLWTILKIQRIPRFFSTVALLNSFNNYMWKTHCFEINSINFLLKLPNSLVYTLYDSIVLAIEEFEAIEGVVDWLLLMQVITGRRMVDWARKRWLWWSL